MNGKEKNTILIVDDMKLNINLLVDILGDDYKIMAALGGNNAISLLRRKTPDLILLDVFMPDVDGFEVLKFIKSHPELSSVPVIFVTGEHAVDIEEKGLELGAVDYIKKPFSKAVIKAKVKNHLELKDYRDNLEIIVKERTKQLLASREAIIMGMSFMSESHDRVTGEHIERIKFYTKILSECMYKMNANSISEEMINQIVLFSPLHDIGKIGISDRILRKTGRLTTDEYDVMKLHTRIGANLLKKTESFLTVKGGDEDLNVAIEIAECHHEKYDGTGYPNGLKGEEIPISARIVALSDVYDALRSSRPYKKAFTHEEAVNIIFTGDEKTNPEHFDPKLLNIFHLVHNEFNKVFEWNSVNRKIKEGALQYALKEGRNGL